MNAIYRPPQAAPMVPENAPFLQEQRAWLNGFFAGLLSSGSQDGTALPAAESAALAAALSPATAPQGLEDDGAPWHDQTLALGERMQLAESRPLPRRMMAAMAQQDCGQCGYNCEDYANAIASQAEDRLDLCVPGAKETARMLKTLVEEMGGGATDPDEAQAKAEAKAAAKALDADTRPGHSRNTPAEAIFLARKRLNREGSEKATYHVEFDIAEAGLDYEPGDSFGIFPVNGDGLVDQVIAAIGAPRDFPIGSKTLREVLREDVSLGLAPDMLFELISYITGGISRAKAKALAKGEDPDGDAATLDVLAAIEKFTRLRPDPEAFIEVLEPLQPRLYSIASSHKAGPGRVALTVDHVRYAIGGRERLGAASTFAGTAGPATRSRPISSAPMISLCRPMAIRPSSWSAQAPASRLSGRFCRSAWRDAARGRPGCSSAINGATRIFSTRTNCQGSRRRARSPSSRSPGRAMAKKRSMSRTRCARKPPIFGLGSARAPISMSAATPSAWRRMSMRLLFKSARNTARWMPPPPRIS
jgi:hypothetical protein